MSLIIQYISMFFVFSVLFIGIILKWGEHVHNEWDLCFLLVICEIGAFSVVVTVKDLIEQYKKHRSN